MEIAFPSIIRGDAFHAIGVLVYVCMCDYYFNRRPLSDNFGIMSIHFYGLLKYYYIIHKI